MMKITLSAFSLVAFLSGAIFFVDESRNGKVLGDDVMSSAIGGSVVYPTSSVPSSETEKVESNGTIEKLETASIESSTSTTPSSAAVAPHPVASGTSSSSGSHSSLSPPSGLSVVIIDATTVRLRWNAVIGAARYRVFRNGSAISTTNEALYRDAVIKAGETYKYAVQAMDSAGKASTLSSVVSVKTNAESNDGDKIEDRSRGTVTHESSGVTGSVSDTVSPSAPDDVVVKMISLTAVRIKWKAARDNVGVANYAVYRNGNVIGTTTKETYYDDITVEEGKRYEYSVKARDIAKNESKPSEVQAIVVSATEKELKEQSKMEVGSPMGESEKYSNRILTVNRIPSKEKMHIDTDGDSISDDEEERIGTDPEIADTDGDGFRDSDEIRGGFDPLRYSPGDKSDKIVFESPKDVSEKKKERVDVRYTIEKIERVVSEKTGAPATKFSGKGLPNSYVTVYIYSDPIIVVVKTDANGNWSYELDRNLEDGDHEVYVAVTDNIGRVTAQSSPLPFIKTAEAVTIRPETLPAQAIKENQSPLKQSFSQYIGIGTIIALLFIFAAVAIIRYRVDSSFRE